MVEVAQNLLGRGHQIRIYDPQLNLAKLVGSNKRFIDTKMPHLASLLQDDLALAAGRQGLRASSWGRWRSNRKSSGRNPAKSLASA